MKRNPMPHFLRSWPALVATALTLLSALRSLSAASTEELYQRGKEAFDKPDYLTAVENLFAFREAAAARLDAETSKAVEAALTYSERQLRTALATKAALDKYGSVITVVTDGKMDDPSGRIRIKDVALAAAPSGGKPVLPDKVAVPPARVMVASRVRAEAVRPSGTLPDKPDTRSVEDLEAENQELRLKLDQQRRQLERLREALAQMEANPPWRPAEMHSPQNP